MKKTNIRYIAAVSGGPDSMAMLDKFKKNIVGVCHVNYHKRTDSDIDMGIVVDYCKRNDISVSVYHVNKNVYKIRQNFQNLARKIRYDFFVECSKKYKCKNLIIAHNLNDFLETAIMQKNRKSFNFFYGIRQNSIYKSLKIYRPLINDFKIDLTKYCDDKKINYALDSSNELDIYERNRIRKQLSKFSKTQLLKLFKQFNTRNIKQAKFEKIINQKFIEWKQTKYSIKYFLAIDKSAINSLIYVYLKNIENVNINYNKIKLVRDYIVSKNVGNGLRLGSNIMLIKKDGKVKIINHVQKNSRKRISK